MATLQINTAESFNQLMADFLENLLVGFPEKEQEIRDVQAQFHSMRESNVTLPVRLFMKGVQPYTTHIRERDERFFLEHCSDIPLLEQVGFADVWTDDMLPQNKESVWRYMDILVSAATDIVSPPADLMTSLNDVTRAYWEEKQEAGVDVDNLNQNEMLGMAVDLVNRMRDDGTMDKLLGPIFSRGLNQ